MVCLPTAEASDCGPAVSAEVALGDLTGPSIKREIDDRDGRENVDHVVPICQIHDPVDCEACEADLYICSSLSSVYTSRAGWLATTVRRARCC